MLVVALVWPLLATKASVHGYDVRSLLYPTTNLLALYAMGLYRREAMVQRRRSWSRIPLVVGIGAVIGTVSCMVLDALSGDGQRTHTLPEAVQGFALATVAFTVVAYIARLLFAGLLSRGVLQRRLLVVGAGSRAWDLLHLLRREGASLHYSVTLLHDPCYGQMDPRLETDASVVRLQGQDVLAAARLVGADQIVVAPDERRGMDVMRLLACKIAGFPVTQYLTFVEHEIRRVDLARMELGWLVYSEGFSFGLLDRLLKRSFDILASGAILLVASPLLLGGMVAIRLEGPGPIFFWQERVTQAGRVFRILKLRTMRVDAEARGAVWALERDNRITRVGTFLRRARIDELPQLWNVLRGDMSIVGPRPERPMFVEELAAKIPLYMQRHAMKAGLTGWAQVNYPYGASINDARSKLSYDLYYVKNYSVVSDFLILAQTLREILWPTGVR